MVSSMPAPRAEENARNLYERVFGKKEQPKQLFGATCINLLKKVAPLDESLARLMKVPKKIFRVGKAGDLSFSTDPQKSVGGVVTSISFGYDFPKEVTDYGILIHSQGSNVFCTLIDSSRKVIVTADVRNVHEDEGEWHTFASRLSRAVIKAENLQAEGRDFRFVVNHNGRIETIK